MLDMPPFRDTTRQGQVQGISPEGDMEVDPPLP